jgi:hypothetical protein
MRNLAREALILAKKIQTDTPQRFVPPSDGTFSRSQMILPGAMFSQTRGYIEKVVNQINGCYENGWYDACAVMMRRLIETLIIESYEHYGISDKIKTKAGDFLSFSDLISSTLSEASWNIGRNAKRGLPRLKDLGHQSAHSRRFNAHREDIERVLSDFRSVAQELIYLSGLK